MAKDVLQQLRDKLSTTEGKGVLMGAETCFMLLDTSSSMDSAFSYKTINGVQREKLTRKIDALRRAVRAFINARIQHQKVTQDAQDLLSIILFPDTTTSEPTKLLVEPSIAGQIHLDRIDSLRAIQPFTPMLQGLEKVKEQLQIRVYGMVRIVIVSDGQPDSESLVLNEVHTLADEFGVIIDTISITDDKRQNEFMKRLAEIGEGEFISADSVDGLEEKMLSAEQERRALMGKGIALLGTGED